MGENIIEDLTVIGEDDPVVAGFTAITKAHDDGRYYSFLLLLLLLFLHVRVLFYCHEISYFKSIAYDVVPVIPISSFLTHVQVSFPRARFCLSWNYGQ